MSIVMKNKLSATALAIATVMGMGYSAMASAANEPLNFNTQITVVSPYDCPVTTAAPVNEWDLTWTLDEVTDTSGKFTYTAGTNAPLAINVTLDKGASATCNFDGMKVGGVVNASGVEAVTGSDGFFRKATSDGFWRYAPVLSRIRLFSDDAQQTPITAALTITDATGKTHTQATTTTPVYNAHEDITAASVAGLGGKEGVSLSDNYIAENAFVPLVGQELSFTGATSARSAAVDVSAIIAKNPENTDGAEDVVAVNNNDIVQLPFTVQIAYK
ncbi:hypothetical protein [Klebsiella spallanzanii]|uniref:hypothetical protein n=1 Tax=Klebsiella spallanzanii TaxID=2587528 RepID=UPI00111A1D09|nr:hypothetical protein [Klebsiella spallanzanii]